MAPKPRMGNDTRQPNFLQRNLTHALLAVAVVCMLIAVRSAWQVGDLLELSDALREKNRLLEQRQALLERENAALQQLAHVTSTVAHLQREQLQAAGIPTETLPPLVPPPESAGNAAR